MPIVSPERGTGYSNGLLLQLPGDPWSIRLAGATSACPAIELYEAGDLVDVISATPVALRQLRGARAAAGSTGPRALAWGRLPAAGCCPEVEFSQGAWRANVRRATVIQVTTWCWLAVADGRYAAVTVRIADGRLRRRLARGLPCC
jgi:hypothetical protein